MKTMFGILSTLLLLCSCSQKASTEMPPWRWKDPEPEVEPQVVEPHPALVELGWTNITAGYAALPDGLALYKSPETMEGVKVIAYIAVADLSKVNWDVCSIDDPDISGTTDPLKTPSQYYTETAAPVIINGGYFFAEGGPE